MKTATKYVILYFGVRSRVLKDDHCQACDVSIEHSGPEQ